MEPINCVEARSRQLQPTERLVQRLLHPDDAAAVHAIYMDETVIPYLTVDPMPRPEFAAMLNDYIAAGTFRVFERRREIVGFANVTRFIGRSKHVAQLGPLAVKASHQGSGVAHTIFTMLLDDLRADGVRRVELTVEVDNPRAIRFYQRQGMAIEGTLRGAYRRAHEDRDIDSYMMALLLAHIEE